MSIQRKIRRRKTPKDTSVASLKSRIHKQYTKAENREKCRQGW
jgi:hypothetical protein